MTKSKNNFFSTGKAAVHASESKMATIYRQKKENYNQNISVTVSPIAVILFLLYSLRITQCNNREKIEICVIFIKIIHKKICQYNVTKKINKMQQHFHRTPKSDFFVIASMHTHSTHMQNMNMLAHKPEEQ